MTGYFAFPPPSVDASPSSRVPFASSSAGNQLPPESVAEPSQPPKPTQEDIRSHRRRSQEEQNQKRLERERQEIWKAELEWVRSGGVIRNRQGRRDMARTELLRAEIRLQEEEKATLARWNTYEQRWRKLLSSDDLVSWSDIPWPIRDPPNSIVQLTPQNIAEFLFSPLDVRGVTGTRKERVRQALLRWHPDKLALLMTRVIDSEDGDVVEGIHAVFMSLRDIQDFVRRQQRSADLD